MTAREESRQSTRGIVERQTDMTGFEQDFHGDLIIHRYPKDPTYRRSGISPPQIGDVARCGHVKTVPHRTPEQCDGAPHCRACDRLAEMAGVR